jgi:hypothetical protein
MWLVFSGHIAGSSGDKTTLMLLMLTHAFLGKHIIPSSWLDAAAVALGLRRFQRDEAGLKLHMLVRGPLRAIES